MGSIGRVYLQKTAAAFWEVFDPEGLRVTGHGPPIASVIQMINSMGGNVPTQNVSEIQLRIVEVATNYRRYGIVPRSYMCLAWTDDVYVAAGLTINRQPCARTAGYLYGVSNNFSNIPVGATIYGFSNSPHGHVGIYIGNGQVVHNVGRVVTDTLANFRANHPNTVWGWPMIPPLEPVTRGLIQRCTLCWPR